MGGRLALARAKVTDPDGTQREVGVHVIGSTLRLTNSRGTIEVERQGVEQVDRLSQLSWRIRLATGEVFTVERKKGCGCGR